MTILSSPIFVTLSAMSLVNVSLKYFSEYSMDHGLSSSQSMWAVSLRNSSVILIPTSLSEIISFVILLVVLCIEYMVSAR